MKPMFHMLTRPLTSSRTDALWGRFACWLASLIVLVLGIRKLTELPLTETELFFGLLLLMTLVLLGVLIGVVLPFAIGSERRSRAR